MTQEERGKALIKLLKQKHGRRAVLITANTAPQRHPLSSKEIFRFLERVPKDDRIKGWATLACQAVLEQTGTEGEASRFFGFKPGYVSERARKPGWEINRAKRSSGIDDNASE
jgi:hypothetical protein